MQAKEQKRENKIFQILAWALLGAVLTYIVCAVSLTGDHTLNGPFYNCGEVDEISITSFRRDIEQEGGHQESSGTVVLDRGAFSYTLSVGRYSDGWNYLCVRIDDLTKETLNCQVTYNNITGGEVKESVTKAYTLSEGMNLLALPEQTFAQIEMSFSGEAECSFSIGSVQFRENPPISNFAKAGIVAVITIFCYVILSWIFWHFYRKADRKEQLRPYVCIEMLQEFYLIVLHRLVVVREKSPRLYQHKRLWRTVLFLFLFCFSAGTNAVRTHYYSFFKYYMLIYSGIFLAIAFLSVEEKVSKKNWNNALVWGWFLTGLCMCVSDFIVRKNTGNYRFAGYAILLAIGFFIFVWNNAKDRGEILEEFTWAIQIFFCVILVYCLLFRPENDGVRYSGFLSNPNIFSKYLVVCWAIAFGALEHEIRNNKKLSKLIIYSIEVCMIFAFTWKTQSATSLVCLATVAIVWLVRMCIYTSRYQIKKMLLGTLLGIAIFFLPVYALLSFDLNYVPQKLGTTVVYEDDVYIEKTTWGIEVYAADADSILQNNRLIQKMKASSLAATFSGRNYVWKEYLRDLNLFGHRTRPYIGATKYYSHNGVLGMAYYNGIFTAVPYVLILVAAFVRMRRFSRTNMRYAATPLFVCISFLILSSVECVEMPFDRFPWFAMYILMGCVFCEPDDENVFLRQEEKSENEIVSV